MAATQKKKQQEVPAPQVEARIDRMVDGDYKKNGETVYNDTFHAVTAEARTALVDAVNDAYEQRLQERMEQSEDVPAQGMEQQM